MSVYSVTCLSVSIVSGRSFMDNPAFELLPRACGAPSQGRFSEQAGTSAEAAGGEITAGGPSRCIVTFSPSPESLTISSRLADASVSAESRFLAQLPVIETVIAQVCRRHHLASTEAKDFGSEVMLHLIERDYEVLQTLPGPKQSCQLPDRCHSSTVSRLPDPVVGQAATISRGETTWRCGHRAGAL